MKKIFTLVFASILFMSCSSDDDSSGPVLTDTPVAKAIYDDTSWGIYKGVFVGSSGVVLIDINNSGAIEATVTIDGNTHNFTTNESVELGDAINGMTFTSGSMSFDFYVDGAGDFPEVTNINFPGHPDAQISLLKEFSDELVECIQGTFSGDDSGAFNLVIQGGDVYGLAHSNDGGDAIYLDGYLDNNQILGYFDGGGFTGTKNGNNVSGSWENDLGESGNFSGQRKL